MNDDDDDNDNDNEDNDDDDNDDDDNDVSDDYHYDDDDSDDDNNDDLGCLLFTSGSRRWGCSSQQEAMFYSSNNVIPNAESCGLLTMGSTDCGPEVVHFAKWFAADCMSTPFTEAEPKSTYSW